MRETVKIYRHIRNERKANNWLKKINIARVWKRWQVSFFGYHVTVINIMIWVDQLSDRSNISTKQVVFKGDITYCFGRGALITCSTNKWSCWHNWWLLWWKRLEELEANCRHETGLVQLEQRRFKQSKIRFKTLWCLVQQNTALFSTFRPPSVRSSVTGVTYQLFSVFWRFIPWKPYILWMHII